MMNCQLPEQRLASIEVQLISAHAIRHMSGLLCPQFDGGQLSKQPCMGQPSCPGVSPGFPCHTQLCMLASGKLLWLDSTDTSIAQALQKLLIATNNLDDRSRLLGLILADLMSARSVTLAGIANATITTFATHFNNVKTDKI